MQLAPIFKYEIRKEKSYREFLVAYHLFVISEPIITVQSDDEITSSGDISIAIRAGCSSRDCEPCCLQSYLGQALLNITSLYYTDIHSVPVDHCIFIIGEYKSIVSVGNHIALF